MAGYGQRIVIEDRQASATIQGAMMMTVTLFVKTFARERQTLLTSLPALEIEPMLQGCAAGRIPPSRRATAQI